MKTNKVVCENCGYEEEVPEFSLVFKNPDEYECPNCGKMELKKEVIVLNPDLNCPNCGSNNLKDNGYGHMRCRDCDFEFKVKPNPNCDHEWEEQEQCLKCGLRREKGENNTVIV